MPLAALLKLGNATKSEQCCSYIPMPTDIMSINCFFFVVVVQIVSCVLEQNPTSLKAYTCLFDARLQQIHRDVRNDCNEYVGMTVSPPSESHSRIKHTANDECVIASWTD